MTISQRTSASPQGPSTKEEIIDAIGLLHAQLKVADKEKIKDLRQEIKDRTNQLFARRLDMDDILLYDSTINGGDLLLAIEEARHPYQIIDAKKRADELLMLAPIESLHEIYIALYAKLLVVYGYDYTHIVGLITESEKGSDNTAALESLWHEIRRSLGAIEAISGLLSEDYNSASWSRFSERKRLLYRLRDQRFVVSIRSQFETIKDQLSSALHAIEEI